MIIKGNLRKKNPNSHISQKDGALAIYRVSDLQGPGAGRVLSPGVHRHEGPVPEAISGSVPLPLSQEHCSST